MIDAIEEAKHIYFKGNNILERLSEKPQQTLSIGELGFGAGRLLVSLMDFLDNTDLKDINIVYNSVELHPITSERMSEILEGFRPKVGALIDQLVKSYSGIDINKPGWQTIELQRPFGTITLNLWIGEALEMVENLNQSCDVWFLDGHSPRKNPEIWRAELLKAIGEKTKSGGSCATFSVAVAVTKDLTSAGFNIEQRPSFAKKRAVLKGTKI